MKKILLLILILFLSIPCVFAKELVLQAGVSIDKIPKDFYGTWRVVSKLIDTNTEALFKESNIDLWNLSRKGDVITLDNPISGARASITISEIDGRSIKFNKTGDYDGNKLSDSVQVILGENNFAGLNNLKLDTVSDIDGHIIKTQWATYKLKGEKISGDSIK